MTNRKRYIGLLLVIALWLGLSAWAWCKPAEEISLSERRPLAQFPSLSEDFVSDFADYAVDQFPLRDAFRKIKALAAYYGFRQSDNNGIYIADGSAVKIEYPLSESSLDTAVQRFSELYEMYLTDCDNILFSIVPDKGYYLGEASGHLTMDYENLFSRMDEALPWAEFVDITDCLTADSYYRTDTHWRQEAIVPAARRLSEALGVPFPDRFTQVELDQDFYGVYCGQAALPLAPDRLNYLIWDGIDDCTVYSHDNGKTTAVYDLDKRSSNDLYDIFLSGGMAIQTVTNPNAATDRELVIFRDSFGSSLAPLLVPAYQTVTLVDTRYVAPVMIGNYVNFSNADVLMLYSTLILNSSNALRK